MDLDVVQLDGCRVEQAYNASRSTNYNHGLSLCACDSLVHSMLSSYAHLHATHRTETTSSAILYASSLSSEPMISVYQPLACSMVISRHPRGGN
jgi:hypothetical protein